MSLIKNSGNRKQFETMDSCSNADQLMLTSKNICVKNV